MKIGLLRVEHTLQLLLVSKAGGWEAPSVHRLTEGTRSKRESICSQCLGRQCEDGNTIALPSSVQKKTYLQALPQIWLISNIMEPQISYSQGQGAKERAGSGQATKQNPTETKKGI